MLRLVASNILRRPLRSSLTVAGVAIAIGILTLIESVGSSYQSQLTRELSSMSIQMMLVPLGCPYDAAARVLKGNTLETSIPCEALDLARRDPDVEIAAPLLMVAVPRPEQGRTDMFVGLDASGIALKKWWRAELGSDRLDAPDAMVMGADAAMVEMRSPGDTFFSPETGKRFNVRGVLAHSGTSDDSLFFIPLETAQKMFNSNDRVTAVAIRLRDPAKIRSVSARLRDIPGVQVVTATEMMGTFLNILGTVRTLLRSVAFVALCASVLGVLNTLLMSVAERSGEFSLFRALGASQWQLYVLVLIEAMVLTLTGAIVGVAINASCGGIVHYLADRFVPFANLPRTSGFGVDALTHSLAIAVFVAGTASIYPALRAALAQPALALKGGD